MDLVYDGFISYSHAADDLLAPRLQSALQRFAKPWWKRRAVRIFRDESSLSANPHLWSSITEALDTSGWFVLLLSPDAAESEWVNQEIAYWVEHRDPKKILPVVTDGEFGWDGDVLGDAAPEALAGVFTEEPRWVDLRGVDTETELDLQNPEFAAAVADIASTIRGIPKDELASEEVRQHRRAIRTAWMGGISLALLAVVAVLASFVALDRQRQAEASAEEATRQAEIAQEERDVAQEARDRADRQAQNAEAQRLTAEAARVLERDAQLSMLLLLEAFSIAVDEDLKGDIAAAARDAAGENRLLRRFEVTQWSGAPAVGLPGRYTFDNRAVLSPDGATVYHITRETNSFAAFRVEDGEPLWEWAPERGEELGFVSVSPDGDVVALSVFGPAGVAGRVVILDTAGQQVVVLPASGCRFVVPAGPGFSPDGEWFSLTDGSADCGDAIRLPDEDWAVVYDTTTWQVVLRHVEPGARNERILLSRAGTNALIAYADLEIGRDLARLVTFPNLDPVIELSPVFPSLSPDGRTIASEGGIEDLDVPSDEIRSFAVVHRSNPGFDIPIETAHSFRAVRGGERTVRADGSDYGFDLDSHIWPFSFSPDGSLMAVSSTDGDAVLDVSNGKVLLQLYENVDTFDATWSEDGELLLTSHPTELLLWSVVPVPLPNEVLASRDWIGYTKDSLVRGFTVAECAEFDIDPCPSLEETRSR